MPKQRIKVTYNYQVAFNDIKQKEVFWDGESDAISEVPNPFVRELIREAIHKNKTIKKGIWKVQLLKTKKKGR